MFIFVPGLGWYSKPTCDQTFSPIGPDSTFATDITTGGIDDQATIIRALLFRTPFNLPCVNGLECLPSELENQARASVVVTRAKPRGADLPVFRLRLVGEEK